MPTNPTRTQFADFLRRLAAGKVKEIEWSRFVVTHYRDPELEEIRRSLGRLCINKAGGVQWSDSEFAALQHWSRTLRGPKQQR